jgi:hypothetical protein
VAFALAPIGEHRSATAGAAAQSFAIRVTPRIRTVTKGTTATYKIVIRHGLRRKVSLRVTSGLPRGATASVRPRLTRKTHATLRIVTKKARIGSRWLRLVARSGPRRATTLVKLVIRAPVPPPPPPGPTPSNFRIAGDLHIPLQPGRTVPLDLALANPGAAEIMVSGLTVSLSGLSAPGADATFPCTLADFAVTQFSGTYGFTLLPERATTLAELGIPAARWPQVTMLNRPVNQNGCRGASLQFAFSGTARGR